MCISQHKTPSDPPFSTAVWWGLVKRSLPLVDLSAFTASQQCQAVFLFTRPDAIRVAERLCMQINFHKKTGLSPSIGLIYENFGAKKVLGVRLWWSALTLVV
jgi:hypothetical protein